MISLNGSIVLTNFAMPKNSNLWHFLPCPHPVGQPFIILPTVESTNTMHATGTGRLASHVPPFLLWNRRPVKGHEAKNGSLRHIEIILSIVLEPLPLQAHNQFLALASRGACPVMISFLNIQGIIQYQVGP